VYVNELPVNWAIGKNISGVFVDKNGKAKWTPVKTGLNGNNLIEITSGLKAGDKVLIPVNLKDKLKNHSRIIVK